MKFRTQHLPPTFGMAALDKLAEELRRLEGEQAERHKLAVEAEYAVERAEQADADVRAKAIRAGKTATPDAAEKATAALQAAKREEAAYTSAIAQVEADLGAALASHGAELSKRQQALIDGAAQKIGRLVDSLEQEIAARVDAQALISWVAGVQAGGVESRQGDDMSAPMFRPRPVPVPVPGPNGENLATAAVLQGLRALAAPRQDSPPALSSALLVLTRRVGRVGGRGGRVRLAVGRSGSGRPST